MFCWIIPTFSVCHQDRCDCGGRKPHIWFYCQQLPLWLLGQQCVTQCADAEVLDSFGLVIDSEDQVIICSITSPICHYSHCSQGSDFRFFRSGQAPRNLRTRSVGLRCECAEWPECDEPGQHGGQCQQQLWGHWERRANAQLPPRLGDSMKLDFFPGGFLFPSLKKTSINDVHPYSKSLGWHIEILWTCVRQLNQLPAFWVILRPESRGYFLANDSIQGCADAAVYCNSITKMPEYAVDDGNPAWRLRPRTIWPYLDISWHILTYLDPFWPPSGFFCRR